MPESRLTRTRDSYDWDVLNPFKEEIRRRLAERQQLLLELEGDGSHDPDPLKSLGLRKCFELRGETIALLEAKLRYAVNKAIELGSDYASNTTGEEPPCQDSLS